MIERPNGQRVVQRYFDLQCIFCNIARDPQKYATTQVWGMNEEMVVISPVGGKNDGHLLFIPRTHVELASTDPVLTANMFEYAAAWLDRLPCGQGNLIVNSGKAAGQTVPHLHIHLVPRGKGDKVAPDWPWA